MKSWKKRNLLCSVPDWGGDEPWSCSADRTGPTEGLGNNAAWEVCKDPRNNPAELNTVKASNRAGRVPTQAIVNSQGSRLSDVNPGEDGLFGAQHSLLHDRETKFLI